MAEFDRAGTRVLVHHPGSNHLAYNLVGGLQREGYVLALRAMAGLVEDENA